jgi:hypothetical protein
MMKFDRGFGASCFLAQRRARFAVRKGGDSKNSRPALISIALIAANASKFNERRSIRKFAVGKL